MMRPTFLTTTTKAGSKKTVDISKAKNTDPVEQHGNFVCPSVSNVFSPSVSWAHQSSTQPSPSSFNKPHKWTAECGNCSPIGISILETYERRNRSTLFVLKLLTAKIERASGALDGTLLRIPQCFSQNSFLKKYISEKIKLNFSKHKKKP